MLYQHFGVKFGFCFHGDWSKKLILQYSGFKLIQPLDSGYLDLNSKMATIIAALARQNVYTESNLTYDVSHKEVLLINYSDCDGDSESRVATSEDTTVHKEILGTQTCIILYIYN